MDAKGKMIRRAEELLAKCCVVTAASVDEEGCPRPVPVVRIASEGCTTIWFSTGTGSVKTRHFRANPKAGLCFYEGGDSVVLTGRIDEVPEPDRRAFWQEWMREHFSLGADDPEFCVLKFTAHRGTFWIGGEFVTYDL